MIWQTVLDVIDAIESWIVGQGYWTQVVLLLAVLGPLCYLLAGLIDRVVEAVLAWHSRRDQPGGPPQPRRRQPGHRSGGGRSVSRRPLPVLTRRWMTIALVAMMIVAVVVAVTR